MVRDVEVVRAHARAQEERCEGAEARGGEAAVMRAALEDVARALIHDSDADVPPPAHLHHIPDRYSCSSLIASWGTTVPDRYSCLSPISVPLYLTGTRVHCHSVYHCIQATQETVRL
jgi:hypothetical protein